MVLVSVVLKSDLEYNLFPAVVVNVFAVTVKGHSVSALIMSSIARLT